MLRQIEDGSIGAVIVKDMSRVGRDYLQVGFYTEVFFREKGVHFVAISNGVDSDINTSSEFAPFLNIMNEWYLRDCSRKIKAVLQAKGRDGKPITNNPPYGYIKDPEDKNRCDMSKPYEWAGVSVVRMLEKPEYMGDTVNFRTKKLSYKDKVAVKNDSDEIVVFTDTHEAIIDRKTWYMVQELRKTKRRINTEGESNPFVGKIFCADCGGKMHYRNEGKRAGRKWRGLPDGSVRTTPACYNCGNYNNSHDQSGKVAGDIAICACADILKKAAGVNGIAGRLGGDEFALMMIGDETRAIELMETVQKEIAMYNAQGKNKFAIDMSVGCQIVLCTEELSIPMVLEKADKIMYEEKKKKGKAR